MNVGSVMLDGSLKDNDTIHSTGISASTIATVLASPQPAFCLAVVAIFATSPSRRRARYRRAEALDEQEGDDRDADEDENRDRRPDAQVQRGEQVVVAEDGHRARAMATRGQDEDVVEHPERVERPEQQRDQD